MIKLIVFDWDGTLSDSVSTIVAAKQYAAKQLYLPVPDYDTAKKVIGQNFSLAMSTCFSSANEDTLKHLKRKFTHYMNQPENCPRLYPGVIDILEFCKSKNIHLAIATEKPRQQLDHALEQHNLSGYFDITLCSEEAISKPAPNMLNITMDRIKAAREKTLMVGDTVNDINFAHNAGVESIAVAYGLDNRQALENASPFMIINKITDLKGIITCMNQQA